MYRRNLLMLRRVALGFTFLLILNLQTFPVSFGNGSGNDYCTSNPVSMSYSGLQISRSSENYTATYNGTLKVLITPDTASKTGARWKAIKTGYDSGWQTSETTLPLMAGTYTVQFLSLAANCWATPQDIVGVVITKGNTTNLSGEYYRVGDIEVFLDSYYASQGGQWRQIRPGLPASEWRDSGYIDYYKPIDDDRQNPYLIEYKTLPNWPALPVDHVPMIWYKRVTHHQSLESGFLQVNLWPVRINYLIHFPYWYLTSDPDDENFSGLSVKLPPNNYTIAFTGISGWITPPTVTLSVYPKNTTYHDAWYTLILSE